MAARGEQYSDLISQLAWVVRTYWSARWIALVSALLATALAVFALFQKDDQSYLTRISFGLEPKVVQSQYDERLLIQNAPFVPKDFTAENIMSWYGIDFIDAIRRVSDGKYSRLRDVDFEISILENGILVRTNGKDHERAIHEGFHKRVSDTLTTVINNSETLYRQELTDYFEAQARELAGIEQSRAILTTEEERTVKLLEAIVAKAGFGEDQAADGAIQAGSGEPTVSSTKPNDDLSSIVLRLTERREALTNQADRLRRSIAEYDRLREGAASGAMVSVLAESYLIDSALNFKFKLAVWVFLVLLVTVTVPFLWILARSIAHSLRG